MSDRIDLLLTAPKKSRVPKRLGDIAKNAPYVILTVGIENIILPMPVNVSSNGAIMWDQKQFTPDSPLGASLIGGYNKNNSYIDAVAVGMTGVLNQGERNVASRVGDLLGIDGANDYIMHKNKSAVNPNAEMTFQGVGYRQFQLDFEFIPLNKEEAENVTDFIQFFQENCLPDFADAYTVYFTYPSAWLVKFSQKWLPQLMPCYLTDYSINYGGVGKMVAHRDSKLDSKYGGSAVQTNISLTFTESQLHTKSSVKGGYRG
ncbi:hypothetical protein FCL47_12945 [Desulfopila sp. IMCC35006]|uniref:hypothetical protein n=1 Tax=Desulfopila sp. IMCC35006 TaxID=2569542 RepID=UPI0010AD437E|nr:hypothetical protein [Desulfopila sp. IMCC35006]TKB25986.1 hypothetical protein FCL47_12945 [Desulfopila sp. IMCC35006]